MEKIKNIYCWNHLNDWIEAQKVGMIHVVESERNGEGLFEWEKLINMLYENCFPQSFLCFRKREEN